MRIPRNNFTEQHFGTQGYPVPLVTQKKIELDIFVHRLEKRAYSTCPAFESPSLSVELSTSAVGVPFSESKSSSVASMSIDGGSMGEHGISNSSLKGVMVLRRRPENILTTGARVKMTNYFSRLAFSSPFSLQFDRCFSNLSNQTIELAVCDGERERDRIRANKNILDENIYFYTNIVLSLFSSLCLSLCYCRNKIPSRTWHHPLPIYLIVMARSHPSAEMAYRDGFTIRSSPSA